MNKHFLFYSKYCYFCQKVLVVLRHHQHPIELLNVSDRDYRNSLIQGGGKSQVPCLKIESEEGAVRWLYESDDILDYLKAQSLLS